MRWVLLARTEHWNWQTCRKCTVLRPPSRRRNRSNIWNPMNMPDAQIHGCGADVGARKGAGSVAISVFSSGGSLAVCTNSDANARPKDCPWVSVGGKFGGKAPPVSTWADELRQTRSVVGCVIAAGASGMPCDNGALKGSSSSRASHHSSVHLKRALPMCHASCLGACNAIPCPSPKKSVVVL